MSIVVLEGSNGTGKSTIIKLLEEKYIFTHSKSIPDKYRELVPKARKLDPETQKMVYMSWHRYKYNSLSREENNILDRFFYSTIIRLNKELNITPEDTVKEIKNIKMYPDLMIYLKTDENIIIKRLEERNNFLFDQNFFRYETEVYSKLSENNDRMVIVDNNKSKQETIERIEKELSKHKILLKRR